jgi:hypothetical protein
VLGVVGGCILLLMIPCFVGRGRGMRMKRLVGRCRLGRGGIRLGLGGSRGLEGDAGGVAGLEGLEVVGLGVLGQGILSRLRTGLGSGQFRGGK